MEKITNDKKGKYLSLEICVDLQQFLPKFHCKLDFIEQVWGFSKHEYYEAPPSSKIEHVEFNSIKALDSVPLGPWRAHMELPK